MTGKYLFYIIPCQNYQECPRHWYSIAIFPMIHNVMGKQIGKFKQFKIPNFIAATYNLRIL